MKLSLNNKMLGLGILIFFSIGLMIGLSQYSSSNTRVMMETSDDANTMLNKRYEQLALLNKYEYSMIQLTLAAMDSIIDKDEGVISEERMENINKRGKFLKENMAQVVAMADTDEEKKLAQDVGKNIDTYINTIKVDLTTAIIKSAKRIKEIEHEFNGIDDSLDQYGDRFNEKLEGVLARFQKKQQASANAQQEAFLASSIKLHLIQVQQWLTDISATRGAKGFDDGFDEAGKHAKEFRKDMKVLKGISPALKKQLNGLEKSFEAFYKKGKWMANQYIQYGPARGNKAMVDFDAFAEDIGGRIQKLIDVTTANANKLSEINKGITHVEKMLKTHIGLMLAAMDSIIDKDEGKINEDRANEINEAIALQNNAIPSLKQFEVLGISQKEIDTLVKDFSGLSKGITVDLTNLIVNSTKEQKEIINLFEKFDDDLDESAGAIEEALHDFRVSVEEEVKEAKNILSDVDIRLENDLKKNSIITWSFSLIVLAVISSLFFLVARGITKPIRIIIEGLNGSSEQVSSASGQVASASQSLAEGASEQAAGIEETSSSLEEMSSMTKQNADNASQADNLMKDANLVVGQANNSMGELITSMEEISKASEETSRIIKSIDEIAFQTNLLALNAAVEAARAGEAGAGFAVVADEVRNLAMRAADAAKNTADLIEGTVKRVNDGSELVTKTNEAFKQVSESAGKVGELVGEIAAASNEQAQGIEQVNKAVTEMDKVVQQNAASAEESASASEEMSAQANQMQSMVGELDSMINGAENENDRTEIGSTKAVHKIQHTRLAQNTRSRQKALKNKKGVSPEKIIPMDDDFSDF